MPASLRCPHSPLAPAHPPTPSAPWQASHVVILLAKKYPNYKIVNFDKLVRRGPTLLSPAVASTFWAQQPRPTPARCAGARAPLAHP